MAGGDERGGHGVTRGQYWDRVTALAEGARAEQAAFDPENDGTNALTTGVAPIVSLYVEAHREGDGLSAVELSLLESALNQWLDEYARNHDVALEAHYSVHEVTMAYAETDDLEEAVRRLLPTEQ